MTPTNWYYARNGQQLGPVTLDELRQQASAGELKPGDLVWGEGMPDWTDARQVPALASSFALAPASDEGEYDLAPGGSPPPAAAPAATAAPYSAPMYAPPQQFTGTYAQPGVLPYGTYQQQPWSQQVHYAGFWIRFVAAFIDGLITSIPGFIMGFMLEVSKAGNPSAQPGPQEVGLALVTNLLSIVIAWLYEAMFTASSYQATPGKMAVGIRVVDEYGNRISFARATGRHFGKIISGIICGFGYFMAGWDDRKQSLHDKMASTLVVYK